MEDKMIIDLADIPPVPIVLGLAGENNFRSFTFDASTWGAGYPSARYNVVYKRPDGYLYPVVLNADTDELVWSPNATDTAVNGDALVEVRLLQGDVVGKTVAMQAIVLPSISGDESEPDKPAPDWVNDVSDDADRAEAAVEHYPQIRNGYWWVWDVANGEWVNTGVKASGEGGSATVIVTIDESTDPMTASMTATEIKAAAAAGNRVVIRIEDAEIPYVHYASPYAIFSIAVDEEWPSILTVFITADGHVIPSSSELAPKSAIPTRTSELTNDSIKEPVYLTVTTENDVISVDKTPAEIDALSGAGYDVHLRIQVPLFGAMLDTQFTGYISRTGYAAFTTEYLGLCFAALVASDKTVEVKSNDLSERLDMVENDVDGLEAQISQIGTVFTLKGGVATVNDLPQTDNNIGDVWYVESVSAGFIWITSTAYPDGYWEELGETVDLSAYAEKTWVQNQGYQTAQQVTTAISTAVSGKADKTPRIAKASTDTTATLNPNTLYVFPEMASLTITLTAPVDLSIVNEYHFIFTSGATATVTDFPQIPGLDDFAAETNMAYEISILEGHALVVSWEVTA